MKVNDLRSYLWIVLDRQKFDGGGRPLRHNMTPSDFVTWGFLFLAHLPARAVVGLSIGLGGAST